MNNKSLLEISWKAGRIPDKRSKHPYILESFHSNILYNEEADGIKERKKTSNDHKMRNNEKIDINDESQGA